MAIKKPLELESAPPEDGDGEAEARYEGYARRLELTTKSGGIHKEFSHQTGTVQVDQAGVEEYRAREEAERQARAEKARENLAKENEKLRVFMEVEQRDLKWGDRVATIEGALKFGLMLAAAFFGIVGLAELYYLSTGAARPSNFGGWTWVGFFLCVALTATLLHTNPKITKIAGRFIYSGVLIYLGLTGVWGLFRTFGDPARFGGTALSFGLAFFSVVLGVAAFQFLFRKRRRLLELYEDPEHEWIRKCPSLGNRAVLDNLVYTVEAVMATLAFALFFTMVFRIDTITFVMMALANNPWMLLIYAYPFCGYFAARKIVASLR